MLERDAGQGWGWSHGAVRGGVLLVLTPGSKAAKQREQGRIYMGKLLLSQFMSNSQIMEYSELEGIQLCSEGSILGLNLGADSTH